VIVGVVEVGVGAALLTVGGRASVLVALIAAALFGGFVLITRMAVVRGASCGCWGSLSDGAAGRKELARRVLLAGVSAMLVAARWYRHPAPAPPLVAAAVLVAAAIAGFGLTGQDGRSAHRRILAGAAFGVPVAGSSTPRRTVPARMRRSIIEELRRDTTIHVVEAALTAHGSLDWRRARVTAPPDPEAAGRLVSVPGHGANLRAVLADQHPVVIIGETAHHIVLGRSGRAIATPKPGRRTVRDPSTGGLPTAASAG